MDKYKIIQVKESVFADNDREADRVRQQLKKQGTFLLNLMSSPGSGKTTTLRGTIARLQSDLRIGVMGCIVNGPGEMADADYGYVGAAPGRITLYKGRTVVERNIPQEEALDRLIALIRENGDWQDPE